MAAPLRHRYLSLNPGASYRGLTMTAWQFILGNENPAFCCACRGTIRRIAHGYARRPASHGMRADSKSGGCTA